MQKHNERGQGDLPSQWVRLVELRALELLRRERCAEEWRKETDVYDTSQKRNQSHHRQDQAEDHVGCTQDQNHTTANQRETSDTRTMRPVDWT